jgi:hypothetical protein
MSILCLISLSNRMYVNSLACMSQTAVRDVGIIPSVVIPYLSLRNKQYLLHLINPLLNCVIQHL